MWLGCHSFFRLQFRFDIIRSVGTFVDVSDGLKGGRPHPSVMVCQIGCIVGLLAFSKEAEKTMNEGVVSKETVVLRRWGSSIQKFGFINGVDNVNWPP